MFFVTHHHPALSDDDPKSVRKTYKEITKTDITRYEDITATEILIFGISFNMSINEALEVIKLNDKVFFEVDPFNSNRYYLYDYEIVKERYLPLAYFIWDENGQKLLEIIIYTGFTKYLVGNTKKLLTLDVINKNSLIVKTFMGYPVKKEVTLDLPSIGLKTFCYYYPNHNFKIFRNITDESTSISLGICRELIFY
ncbi:MAG TPA: hypothetical protein P5050_06790 [Bacteroidia bacterium]|nr:hypothetical protein [Bacteroidia bacterium]HRS58913.1 hypothetical protein [Bacteroidia bacterium]HRU67409.1 hypothetical protein [Bacteroidia bacterium]